MSAIRRLIVSSLVALATVVGTAAQANAQSDGRGSARTEVRGVVKSLDTATEMITVSVVEGREPVREMTYPLAKDVEVVIGGGGDRRIVFVLKEGKLADLVPGTSVSLTLTAGNAVVEAIVAEGPTIRGRLTGVDLTKNTITVSAVGSSSRDRTEPAAEEKIFTLSLPPDVEIAVDDGRGRRFSIHEGKIADLATGALITVRLSLDQKQAVSLQVEGPNIVGVVKSVDPARNSLTVSFGGGGRGRGEEQVLEQTVELAGDAVVLLDDGRGRRLSVKEGKLADLPVGAAVNLRMSVDQRYATLVRAEGATLPGQIRAVDTTAGTITIARVSRGENLDARTLPVAKDARIVIDGIEAKLADIKISDTGPFATLRLSLDQKTVQSILAGQSR